MPLLIKKRRERILKLFGLSEIGFTIIIHYVGIQYIVHVEPHFLFYIGLILLFRKTFFFSILNESSFIYESPFEFGTFLDLFI